MIYDGETCHANGTTGELAASNKTYSKNGANGRSEYVGYTYKETFQRPGLDTGNTKTLEESNLKTETEKWFNLKITGNNLLRVADGYFCNDRNLKSGTWATQPSSKQYYAAQGRLESAKTPTLACDPDDVYTLKAGAITADEVSFAGGVYGTENSSYYLYNGQYYWTMSPYYWYYSSMSNRGAGVFRVYDDGRLGYTLVNDTWGVRPVINLKADTTLTGKGTINEPYEVLD